MLALISVMMWPWPVMWTPASTWTIPSTHAAVSSCSASVTPTSIGTNTTDTLQFTVNNSDSVDIRWVRLTAPSEAFEITTGSTAGWATSIDSPTQIIFRFGTLSAGGSQVFNVTVQTGVTTQDSAPWTVEASDTTGGASPFGCSGSPSVAIVAPSSPPVISGISAGSLTASGATITWTTDKSASSTVDYGATTSYGSTNSDATLRTSHSRALTGLAASTAYHYKVSSTDSAGNTTTSADNTFTTAVAAVEATATPQPTPEASAGKATPTPTAEVAATPVATAKPPTPPLSGGTPTPTPTALADTSNPTVLLRNVPTKPVSQPGAITGTVRDDTAVARVQFSTDGGRNWLPVNTVSTPGVVQTAFSFTPRVTADGNYPMLVRAFDTSGNVGVSAPFELIIDQVPPEVGTALFSIGPQLLQPDQDGVLFGLPGLDYTVTLAARGGATQIDLHLNDSTHSLVQNQGTGLWSGVIHVAEPGIYPILARSLDGAGNVTERVLGTLQAVPGGQVVGPDGQPVTGATVELHYFEPAVDDFVVWRGAAFRQTNPQTTTPDGRFSFLPPAGRYYLAIEAPGWRPARSTIFTLDRPQPLEVSLRLEREGRLPAWRVTSVPVQIAARKSGTEHPLLNQSLPEFTGEANGPRVFSVLTGWSPQASEQMAALNELRQSSPETVSSLISESPPVGVRLWQERGKYQVPIIVDPTGEKQRELSVTTTPLHFILDGEGKVKEVVSGLVSAQTLAELLR